MPPEQDIRESARELVALLEQARRIPLTDQARVDAERALELVDSIRRGSSPGDSRLAGLADAASAVEDAFRHAMPVPLTDQVRLPRERFDELVRALRAAGA